MNDLNQTEELPVDQQAFAASIRGETPQTLAQKLEQAGHAEPVDLPAQELRGQLAYLRGQSPICPPLPPRGDADCDESAGDALTGAVVAVFGLLVGVGLAWLFWCLL